MKMAAGPNVVINNIIYEKNSILRVLMDQFCIYKILLNIKLSY